MTEQPNNNKGNQFGTFAGVFTPSILTILGVIMFLRTGYIVGQGGIFQALIVLLLAQSIVLATAASMSAIATNTPVYGGGAYFLISRSIGPQFGGAIGIILFLAQGLSVPFYIIGFSQSMVQSFPILNPYLAIIALFTTLFLFTAAYLSAQIAIRIQYVVMGILVLAILSMFSGAILRFEAVIFIENWPVLSGPDYIGFGNIFAIFFPAVTGILAGINMSGDLKDPGRSLVKGTFAAIMVGLIIYGAQIILSGGSQVRADLLERPFQTYLNQALFGFSFLVMGGVFAATLSSALGSYLGSPRVLQAFARDDIIPFFKPFSSGSRENDEPRAAMLLTLLLTLSVIGLATRSDDIGAFDYVARIVTMFFLSTYAMINLAAFVESFGKNPSFRPRFRKYHWSIALLGLFGSVAAMFIVDVYAALIAISLVALCYFLISRRVYEAAFGDARRGFLFTLIKSSLHRLYRGRVHPKNWRPTMLVLSGNPDTRASLMRFGIWLEAGRGLLTAAVIIPGRLADKITERKKALQEMDNYFAEQKIRGFSEVLVTDKFDEGLRILIQTQSIGPIKPNTVLLGWPVQDKRIVPYVRYLADIYAAGLSILCLIENTRAPLISPMRIDIWWRGYENGSLMLILAHLLIINWEWKGAKIRVLRQVNSRQDALEAYENIETLISESRMEVDNKVIISEESFKSVLDKHSGDASLVLLGFSNPDENKANEFYEQFTDLTENLGRVLLVNSNGEADLLA